MLIEHSSLCSFKKGGYFPIKLKFAYTSLPIRSLPTQVAPKPHSLFEGVWANSRVHLYRAWSFGTKLPYVEHTQNRHQLPCEHRLRKLELFSPENKKSCGNLIVTFQCLKGTYMEAGEGLFVKKCSDRARGNGWV